MCVIVVVCLRCVFAVVSCVMCCDNVVCVRVCFFNVFGFRVVVDVLLFVVCWVLLRVVV